MEETLEDAERRGACFGAQAYGEGCCALVGAIAAVVASSSTEAAAVVPAATVAAAEAAAVAIAMGIAAAVAAALPEAATVVSVAAAAVAVAVAVAVALTAMVAGGRRSGDDGGEGKGGLVDRISAFGGAQRDVTSGSEEGREVCFGAQSCPRRSAGGVGGVLLPPEETVYVSRPWLLGTLLTRHDRTVHLRHLRKPYHLGVAPCGDFLFTCCDRMLLSHASDGRYDLSTLDD